MGRILGHARPAEMEARAKAFTAARAAIKDDLSQEAAAATYGSSVASVSEVTLILIHGTAQEIHNCETGGVGIGRMADSIRARVPHEERQAKSRRPPQNPRPLVLEPVLQDAREFDARVWANLRDAIDLLTTMPAAADMVDIVKKNASRREYISRRVLPAQTWLEEFVNAWTE